MIIKKVEVWDTPAPKRTRVAGYARVSSAKEAQLHSLSAQISHYSQYIQSRPDWEYVGVYADDITGTKDNREEFQRLLSDCRAGRVDMILTKSISRFARNTVTLLEEVRELKAIGVDVFFERENIHTISSEGELVLTILSSYAQEESLSVSENCKWRIKKKFENGESVGFYNLYGYNYVHGEMVINDAQAEIVRRIYREYIDGAGTLKISKGLNADGIPAFGGGKWNTSVISNLLSNEKFTGNCLLQKTVTVDHLKKRRIKNRGEYAQYYAQHTHPAIIDADIFEKAQRIRKERAEYFAASAPAKTYPLSGKITCGCCGSNYRRKTTHGKHHWQCGTFLTLGKERCGRSKQIPEEILLALTEELGGAEKIQKVLIPEPNNIVFTLADGSSVERVWQDRSRRESWTDEMKETARQYAKARYQKDGD